MITTNLSGIHCGSSPSQDAYYSKFPILTFVDRKSFNNLQGRDFAITDFPKVVNNYSDQHSAISAMTQDYMRFLNNEMHRILFGIRLGDQACRLNSTDITYIKDLFINNLSASYETPDSFYEILPISDTEYLVVLENGFLHYLTSTKSAPEEFTLACLRCMHKFKCDKSQLIRLYLSLRLIDGYNQLLSLRVQ